LKSYKDGIIASNVEISPNIFEIVLEGDFKGIPGQFYMLRGWNGLDPFLARPISIADLQEGAITFLYEVRGRGTHIISQLKKGDKLSLLGPLGNGFDFKIEGRIGLVSGGIGLAPMYYLAKSLEARSDLYAGFRSQPYFMDKFLPYSKSIYISTEDGSVGHKGYIIDIFNPHHYDLVIACGPSPMLKVLMEKCRGIVPVYLSMESYMGCGVGTCLGCTIKTTKGMERVCKEGPVFLSEEVVFDE